MHQISESTRIVRNDAMPSGAVDGETVAMDLDRGAVFGLDEVGSAIWELSAEPVSVGAITDALTERFDVDRARCLEDVTAFVAELIEEGLLLRLDG